MTELKFCPFCGSENLHLYYYNVDDKGDTFDPCVKCNSCRTIFKFIDGHGSLSDIQKVWNNRVKD